MASDLTRLLRGTRQGYVGGHVQQGVALLECNQNEAAQARSDDFKAAIREVAGVRGSRDDGFLPDLAPGQIVTSRLVRFGGFVQAYVLDYPLKAGSFHLGGWRLEQPAPVSAVFQREFLQVGPAAVPLAQIGTQRQLSILRAWEQSVSAIEDAELIEAAMHGADGALRLRRMRRVETRTVDAEDCAVAFDEVLETLGHGDTATYDPATGRLTSNARLQLTFGADPPGDCPGCDPVLRGRYLGREAHAIRIMLAGTDSYVWAIDDGAPLYRAKVISDGTGAMVEMLTPPKDRYHEPGIDRVVELLPWSALLENGAPSAGGKGIGQPLSNEKVAEKAGVLAAVDAPYDAADRSFHVQIDSAALQAIGFAGTGSGKKTQSAEKTAQKAVKTGTPPGQEIVALEWDPAHPNAAELNPGDAEDDAEIGFVYLRFWHVRRPGEGVALPVSGDAPLGRTGIVPVFGGRGRRGDFWRATLRVAAPDRIVPWAILEPGGVPPDGPVEAVAPLALVTWRSLFGTSHEVLSVEDCRPNLTPITGRGCCTHVVSEVAGARYQTVQAAIDALPAAGGRVCIRAGTYPGAFHLAGRDRVVIEGCGSRTRLVSDESPGPSLATLDGRPGGRIILRNLAIETRGQIGVELLGEGLRLERLELRSEPSETAPAASAVRGHGVADIAVRDCRVVIAAGASDHAAITLGGAGISLESCDIDHEAGGTQRAWGGVHVASGSQGVEIRGTRITVAGGHGVTLGDVAWRAPDGSALDGEGPGLGQRLDDGTPTPTGRPAPQDVDGQTYFPEPGLPITGLLIADCEIADCGGSGIGALALEIRHGDVARAAPLCMRRMTFPVSGQIRGNRLLRNAAGPGATDPEFCRGGIVLSEAAELALRDNLIDGPAEDEASGPRAGLAVAFGNGLCVAGNRVTLTQAGRSPSGDLCGGIVLGWARQQPAAGLLRSDAEMNGVRVEDNIVSVALAPALTLVAGGACAVTGNALETLAGPDDTEPGETSTLVVLHPTRVAEAIDLPAGEPSPDRWIQPVGSQDFLAGPAQDIAADGTLLVADNQITTGARAPAGTEFATLGPPVAVLSRGSVGFLENQAQIRVRGATLEAHVIVVGATVTAVGNRVAENVEAGLVSLIGAGQFLTLGSDNILTHCPVVFGAANHDDDRFFAAAGNLTWFRLQSDRCEAVAGERHPDLIALGEAIFGAADPDAFTTNLTPPVFRRTEP